MPNYQINKHLFRYMILSTLMCTFFLIKIGISFIKTIQAPGYILHKTAEAYETPPPYHGIGVYVIHLDRAKKRLNHIMPQVKKLGLPIHMIHAVDGKKLSPKTIEKVADLKGWARFDTMPLKTGTIGCSLSYLKAYQTFLKSHNQYALIFEDDVSFSQKKLLSAIHQLIKQPKLWDLVNFDVGHILVNSTNQIKPSILYDPLNFNMIQLQSPKVDFKLIRQHIWSSGGYLLNRKAAKRLVEVWLPIKIAADYYLRRDWELGIITLETIPPLVKQTFGTSDRLATQSISTHLDRQSTNQFLKKSKWMRTLYHIKIYLKAKEHLL